MWYNTCMDYKEHIEHALEYIEDNLRAERAFKSEHNCLPSEYKASGNSLKMFGRLRLDLAPFKVAPEIVTMEGFQLVVYENSEISAPEFWNLYNCRKLSLRLSGGKIVADYGVSLWNSKTNRVDYLIGIRADDAAGDTAGTVRIDIPGGMYAVFSTPPSSHFSFVNTIHRTWKYIMEEWIPHCEYRPVHSPQFETYVEASRTFSEDIYMPAHCGSFCGLEARVPSGVDGHTPELSSHQACRCCIR